MDQTDFYGGPAIGGSLGWIGVSWTAGGLARRSSMRYEDQE